MLAAPGKAIIVIPGLASGGYGKVLMICKAVCKLIMDIW